MQRAINLPHLLRALRPVGQRLREQVAVHQERGAVDIDRIAGARDDIRWNMAALPAA